MSTGPQDSPDHRYQAPIPPVQGETTDSTSGGGHARYVRAEPIPGTGGENVGGGPFGPWTQSFPRAGGPALGSIPPEFIPRRKSLLLAGLLGLVLGPIGMLYSTFVGAFLMTGIMLLVAIVTLFQGVPFVLPLCMLWAVWAAHRKNQRIRLLEAYVRR